MYKGIVDCELFRVSGKYTMFLGESMPMLFRLIHQYPHTDHITFRNWNCLIICLQYCYYLFTIL